MAELSQQKHEMATRAPSGAGNEQPYSDPAVEKIESYLRALWLALAAAVGGVAAIVYFAGPLTAAKVVVACTCFSLAVLCLTIVVMKRWLLMNMIELEEMGHLAREEAMLNLRQTRHGLSGLQEKLDATLRPETEGMMGEIAKHVAPLMSMLIKKEKSTASWFMFGLKLARSTMEIIKQRK